MTTSNELRALLERVEGGSDVDYDLEQDLFAAFAHAAHLKWGDDDRYTRSIDAAVGLVENVLPGWIVGYEPRYYEEGERVRYRCILSKVDWQRYTPHGDHVTRSEDVGHSATPARAIVAALLRAKLAQEDKKRGRSQKLPVN